MKLLIDNSDAVAGCRSEGTLIGRDVVAGRGFEGTSIERDVVVVDCSDG